MRTRITWVVTLIICLQTLGACSSFGNNVISSETSASGVPCFAVKQTKQFPANTDPPVDLTPIRSPDELSYGELKEKFEKLHAQMINTDDQAASSAIWTELDNSWRALVGKTLVGWNGWVVSNGNATSELVKYWSDAAAGVPNPNDPAVILLALDDPYAVIPPSETSTPFDSGILGPPALHPMEVLVQREGAAVEQPTCLGQKVRFDGTVRLVAHHYTLQGLVISSSHVVPVDNSPVETPTAEDLRDVEISLERTVCFGTCPAYRVTVYGDGMVVFKGDVSTRIRGFKIDKIGEDKVRQLLGEFDKADFFALKDYTEHKVTDNPSAITSIKMPGKSKTVNHYFGDDSAPQKLIHLEEKIDEILNTAQWVK